MEEQRKREAEAKRQHEAEERRKKETAEEEATRQKEAEEERERENDENRRREEAKKAAEAEENRRQQEKDAASQQSAADPKARMAEMKRQMADVKAAAAAKPKLKPPSESHRRNKNRIEEDQPKMALSKERARKCYMWYARLGQPNRDSMIASAKKLTHNDDITPEEVEALPWICGGALLPVKEMNELFLHG